MFYLVFSFTYSSQCFTFKSSFLFNIHVLIWHLFSRKSRRKLLQSCFLIPLGFRNTVHQKLKSQSTTNQFSTVCKEGCEAAGAKYMDRWSFSSFFLDHNIQKQGLLLFPLVYGTSWGPHFSQWAFQQTSKRKPTSDRNVILYPFSVCLLSHLL